MKPPGPLAPETERDVGRLIRRAADAVTVEPGVIDAVERAIRRRHRRRRIALNATLVAAIVALVVGAASLLDGDRSTSPEFAREGAEPTTTGSPSSASPRVVAECEAISSIPLTLDPPLGVAVTATRLTLQSEPATSVSCSAADGSPLEGVLSALVIEVPAASCQSISGRATGLGEVTYTDGSTMAITLDTDFSSLEVRVTNGLLSGATGSTTTRFSVAGDCASGMVGADASIDGFTLEV